MRWVARSDWCISVPPMVRAAGPSVVLLASIRRDFAQAVLCGKDASPTRAVAVTLRSQRAAHSRTKGGARTVYGPGTALPRGGGGPQAGEPISGGGASRPLSTGTSSVSRCTRCAAMPGGAGASGTSRSVGSGWAVEASARGSQCSHSASM